MRKLVIASVVAVLLLGTSIAVLTAIGAPSPFSSDTSVAGPSISGAAVQQQNLATLVPAPEPVRTIDPEAMAIIDKMLPAMEGLKSFRSVQSSSYAGLTSQNASSFPPFDSTDDVEWSGHFYRQVISSRLGGYEQINTGGKSYDRDLFSNMWRVEDDTRNIKSPMSFVRLGWQGIIGAQLAGSEVIDGVEAYHIRFSLIPPPTPGEKTPQSPRSGDVWIGKSDYLIRQVNTCEEFSSLPDKGVWACDVVKYTKLNESVEIVPPVGGAQGTGGEVIPGADLTGPSGTPAPAVTSDPEAARIATLAPQAMSALKSFHFKSSDTGDSRTTAEGDVLRPTGSRVTYASVPFGFLSKSEEILVNGTAYSQEQEPARENWQIARESSRENVLSLDPNYPIDLRTNVTLKLLGTEKVDGVDTYHLSYVWKWQMSQTQGEIWIGKADHYIHQLRSELYLGAAGKIYQLIKLSKFNERLEIRAPLNASGSSAPTSPPVASSQARPILDASDKVMLAMKSAHLSAEMTGAGANIAGQGAADGMSISATGDISGTQGYHFMITSSTVITEVIGVGGKTYTRTPPDGQWQEGPNDLPPGATSEPMTPSTLSKWAGDQATVDLVGSEVIDGVDCYHLRATGDALSVEMWIGKSDSYLRQAIVTPPQTGPITGTPAPSSGSFEIHLSKFNEPIDIKPPS